MHSPETLICSFEKLGIQLWHIDPCKGPGGDDTCGWFKRAHHGDPEVLKKIKQRFEEDWDRTWTYDPSEDGDGTLEEMEAGKRTYACGYFNPNNMPRFSVTGIVLNLFFIAAAQHFKCDGRTGWNKAKKFMRKYVFDIMLFAENPTDSLFDSITCKFGNDSTRNQRIEHFAAIIYGWILRAEQRWWQHPRWHVHHWRISVVAIHRIKRWMFYRCVDCGERISLRGSVICHSWTGDGPYTCPRCAGSQVGKTEGTANV